MQISYCDKMGFVYVHNNAGNCIGLTMVQIKQLNDFFG